MLASIRSPPTDGFSIGPILLHANGLAYVAAVAAAVWICSRRREAHGGSRELVQERALWGFPAGIVAARLYHVVTSWNQVPHTWWGPSAVWKGGRGIWGGIVFGVLVGRWRVRRRGADLAVTLDAAAPAILVAQGDRGRSATMSTRSCSAARPACRGALRSMRSTGRPATSLTPRSSRRSCTS